MGSVVVVVVCAADAAVDGDEEDDEGGQVSPSLPERHSLLLMSQA